jgi:hypothetical protein
LAGDEDRSQTESSDCNPGVCPPVLIGGHAVVITAVVVAYGPGKPEGICPTIAATVPIASQTTMTKRLRSHRSR